MKLPFVNDKPVRLIELFGGIGSQAMALTRLGIDFEHYRLVEFDKYPVASSLVYACEALAKAMITERKVLSNEI